MSDPIGWIVRANAGRDREGIFCVVGTQERGEYLLLADGKRRKLARPKRKKLRHTQLLAPCPDGFDHPALEKLRQTGSATDPELRRALAAFKGR